MRNSRDHGRVIGTLIVDSIFSINDAPLKNGESILARKAVAVLSVVLATSTVSLQTPLVSTATTERLQRVNAARCASFPNRKLSSEFGMWVAWKMREDHAAMMFLEQHIRVFRWIG
ncbi:hypothetical protein CK489_12660 [Bradyrhizobium sp. UFLA03-84]|nr:hypothetical protein CK489_12660 [Bradyrhizobium sp. UFLA03-84]